MPHSIRVYAKLFIDLAAHGKERWSSMLANSFITTMNEEKTDATEYCIDSPVDGGAVRWLLALPLQRRDQ